MGGVISLISTLSIYPVPIKEGKENYMKHILFEANYLELCKTG
jgi:hypothetical protein